MKHQGPAHLSVELIRGESRTALALQEGEFLIGSASHCDVRMRPDEAAREQLRVVFREGEIYAQVLATEPPCLGPEGTFFGGYLPDGAELNIGKVTLRLVKASEGALAARSQAGQGELPPAVQAVGLVAVALGLYLVLQQSPEASLLEAAPTPTPLFEGDAAQQPEACPAQDPEGAAYEMRRRLKQARLKRERAPFYARAGLDAVTLFRQAGACARQAGDAPHADSYLEEARRLSQAMGDEVHVRQLRLELLLRRERYLEAQHEVTVLRGFLGSRETAYVHWLAEVERELSARFARAEEGA